MNHRVIEWFSRYAFPLVVIAFIALFALFLLAVDAFSQVIERRDCRVTATKMSVAWDYSRASGCMVMIDHQWVPLGAVRKEVR